MIYLDYSATTPVEKEVLDTFYKTSLEYIGNPNSLHRLGVESSKLMDAATKQVADLLGVNTNEVIFTSGASEANNLALIGVIQKYKNRGKHIITTKLEHSSVLECVDYLESIGYIIDYVNTKTDGLVDINDLKKLLTKDTILVSINHVNSEVGTIQEVNEIGKFLEKYPTIIFHVDGTQAVGKIPVSLDYIDLYSFSAHKFYGIKGVGCLIKKDNIELESMIHGGKSQTKYRSGTPALGLIVSCSKALRLALFELDKKYLEVQNKCSFLKNELKKIDGVVINSNHLSIPHILNISIKGIKPETMLHALEEKDIYISTKTACSNDSNNSLALSAMNKSTEISGYSIRISISHKTTSEELEIFINEFRECVKLLNFKKRD